MTLRVRLENLSIKTGSSGFEESSLSKEEWDDALENVDEFELEYEDELENERPLLLPLSDCLLFLF